MFRGKVKCLILVMFFTMASAVSISKMPQPKGRKLFGGYRIAPKVCQPTSPGRLRSEGPAICMFNYECSRRRGEVVGACMDGFLFGACCQLPRSDTGALEKTTATGLEDEAALNVHEIDHVPDIPILLSADGRPLGTDHSTKSQALLTELPTLDTLEDGYSQLLGNEQTLEDLKLPSLIQSQGGNHLEEHRQPVATLLRPDQVFQVADPVDQLPALFSHGLRQDNSTGAETILLSENGTRLHEAQDPDELFKPASTERAVLTTRHSAAPNKLSSLVTKASFAQQNDRTPTPTRKISSTLPMTTTGDRRPSPSSHSTPYDATTPLGLTTRRGDELLRLPTGNKKHDQLDREEIAINHIISILNDTNNAKVTTQVTKGPTTYEWMSSEAVSKPNVVKIITNRPSTNPTESLPHPYYGSSASGNYYHYTSSVTEPSRFSSSYYPSSYSVHPFSTQPSSYYEVGSSSTSSSSSSSSSSSYPYSSRPTTNPPAPTVIVLGPFSPEYTTQPTQSTPSRPTGGNQKIPSNSQQSNATRPSHATKKPSVATKKPSIATTLTHNISTVISGNKQVLSVSYISVNLKDGTTTTTTTSTTKEPATKRPASVYTSLGSWSDKPSFRPKPSSAAPPVVEFPSSEASTTKPSFTTETTTSSCEEETAASDDVNNFPPVRHPELDSTVTHFQEKPTFVEPDTEDEIPTPGFVEDAELNNKVDVFVNKIVESLQGNFQNLKDVVYNPKNVTTVQTSSQGTKRPTVSTTTKRPTVKPTLKATRKPTVTKATTTAKPPGTRKPTTTTKRTKPPKKVTTAAPLSTEVLDADTTTVSRPVEVTTQFPEIKPHSDFRSICGVRPLIKTGRIVGGKGATFGEWPWQVLVREATWLGLFTKNKCGGVLITDKYVITAAHCQPGFLASLVAVFGEFDISGELESRRSVTRNVRRVIVNRAYDPATFENDLALLELETPVQFDAHIVPICMPDENTDYVNRMATVTGWGRLKYNGGVPSVLQEVKVPIMENSVCQEMFQTAGHSKLILDSFMCAGYSNGQKDSCEGDSGGPLTLQRPDGRWILVGTVSHGIKCAAPYLPGVYMRTTFFKPWLHSVTGA